MKLESHFSPGDKAWVFDGDMASLVTVGQIRLTLTDSKGIPGETLFSNYMAHKGFVEEYMCVETGIKSGSIWTYGKNIFSSEAECLAANADRIKQQQQAKEEMRKLDIQRAKQNMLDAQEELNRLALKERKI
jgi:hypothetical protein